MASEEKKTSPNSDSEQTRINDDFQTMQWKFHELAIVDKNQPHT